MRSETAWEVVELSQICTYRQERIEVDKLTTSNYISTANMLPNKSGIEVADNLPNTKTTSRFYVNDVLVSNIRPYFKKAWLATLDGGCSNDVLVMRALDDVYAPYLYYLLSSDQFFAYMTSTAKETKMPRGDKDAIMRYMIQKPPLNVQKAIADILSCLDSKIELNNKINENLEAQAQAIFKSWFVDFEPFQDGAFVESELGLIPEGWRVGSLQEIAEITMGQSPKGTTYNEDGVGKVFYQGRAEFGWRFPSRRLYTTDPKRMAEKNDVLMSVRAPVGDINVANESCCIGRGLASLRNTTYPSFLLYLMRSYKERLNQFNAEGTVFGSINQGSLKSMSVIIPPDNVVHLFEEKVASFDQMIGSLSRQNTTLTALRDTLLPKLMSGEIEVPVD